MTVLLISTNAFQMIIFKYLEDKDIFQQFYSTKLSKRLIHSVSASDEAEASMISKLKEACGFEYTNKLQRMFTGTYCRFDIRPSYLPNLSFHSSPRPPKSQKRMFELSTYAVFILILARAQTSTPTGGIRRP